MTRADINRGAIGDIVAIAARCGIPPRRYGMKLSRILHAPDTEAFETAIAELLQAIVDAINDGDCASGRKTNVLRVPNDI